MKSSLSSASSLLQLCFNFASTKTPLFGASWRILAHFGFLQHQREKRWNPLTIKGLSGGEGGIRTHGTMQGGVMPLFACNCVGMFVCD